MFAGVKNGTELIKESMKAFRRFPSLLIPLLACWAIYAPVTLYLKFFFPWDDYNRFQQFWWLFLIILFFSFILSVSCIILLELIEQIETGRKLNIFLASFSSIGKIIQALPVTISWAIIWFTITVIELLLRRKDDDAEDEDMDFTPENVAETLGGFEEFSLSSAFFDALRKGVRMIAFLIYPAIAWENNSFLAATKKGLAVAKIHKTEFATGFVLTELAAAFVFLPPAILFLLKSKLHITFPDPVWYITIIYCGFAWSFSMFLEQMFTAELYLWHMLWRKECATAESTGSELPSLQDVKRPSIIDNTPDLTNAVES